MTWLKKDAILRRVGCALTLMLLALPGAAWAQLSLTRQYVYDGQQRLCKIIEPETGTTVIGYDAAGNEYWRAAGLDLPSTTSCDHLVAWHSGRRVTRSFDARNRLATLAFPDGRGDQAWTYTPDSLPASITTWNEPGTDPVINRYRYNSRQAVAEETTRHGAYPSTVRYGFNAYGHRTLYITPDALEVHSEVDALGRPLRVHAAWGKNFASGIQYHPNGAIKKFTYGNGIVHTSSQNARQLLERNTDAHGGVAVLDDIHDFDANRNVVGITDGASGRNQRGNRTMAYDGLDRLVAVSSPMFTAARYEYDALDNLKRITIGGAASRDHWYCRDATNRLTNIKTGGCSGASVVGLGYDVQGNVVNKNGQAFDFDYGNRLRAVAGKERYHYDGHGRRATAFSATGVPIRWHYDHAGRLVYQQDERRRMNVPHVYLGDRLIATIEWDVATGRAQTRYQHHDALGSPVVVTDDNRTVVERSEYEPFGRLLNRPMVDGVGYTGQVLDSQTGNVYMQARYMDPALGVFTSVDPVTAHGTGDWRLFGRYEYAFNNPYRFTDPDGRQSREFNFENRRLGITPPPRSEQDWLGPLIGYSLAGMLAAPVAAEAYLAMLANPVAATNVIVELGEAASGAASIGATGKVGEQALKAALGGQSQVFFRTSHGARFIDQLANGVAHESKVGYHTLTSDIGRQISKDVELIRMERIQGSTWHFFKSPSTGVGGPSKPLMEALQKSNIDVIVH